jgi:predicted secreted Zn-dependent protease
MSVPMMRHFLRFGVTALAFAGAGMAAPPPAIPAAFAGMPPIDFRYYDVAGRDEREIQVALLRSAMRRPDGSTASGLTAWTLQNHWGEYSDQRGCRIRDARADLRMTVTLPRLKNADRLPPRAIAWWAGYQRTIERHEAGHARIAIDHAGDFARAAEGARCADIERISQKVMAKIVALQDDYDRVTQHGQTQERVD